MKIPAKDGYPEMEILKVWWGRGRRGVAIIPSELLAEKIMVVDEANRRYKTLSREYIDEQFKDVFPGHTKEAYHRFLIQIADEFTEDEWHDIPELKESPNETSKASSP